jgi:1-acyl-sn-glycerol-3-phosphate acyltransferase
VVANHRSSVDPLAVAAQTRRLIRFLMAREYYEIFGMRWFLRTLRAIPVRRDGRDLTATKDALRALASGEIVGIFPEGRIREPRSSDTVADDDWFQSVKDGAAVLALRTGAPVVVAWVDGTPQTDSVLRAFFTRSHTRVVFAEPISFAATSATGTRRQAAEVTRKIVERLDNLRMRAGEGAAAITH